MINVKQAIEIVLKGHPTLAIGIALDFGDFFGFNLVQKEAAWTENFQSGTIMRAVDKKTGKTFMYDITEDVDLYMKAKKIRPKGAQKNGS